MIFRFATKWITRTNHDVATRSRCNEIVLFFVVVLIIEINLIEDEEENEDEDLRKEQNLSCTSYTVYLWRVARKLLACRFPKNK
jgi:hypothetical protein